MLPKVAEALIRFVKPVRVKDEEDTSEDLKKADDQSTQNEAQNSEPNDSGAEISADAPDAGPEPDAPKIPFDQSSPLSLSQKLLHIIDAFRTKKVGTENGQVAYKKSQKSQGGVRSQKGTIMDRKVG